MLESRDIKFRFWDKEDKTMNECSRIDLPNSTIPDPKDDNGYIAMQFTGLICSNGDEVYEGDIVYVAGKGDCEVVFDCCGYWAFGESREDYQDVIEDMERVVGHVFET